MTSNTQPLNNDYMSQLQILSAVKNVDRDLWKSNNAQTVDIITNAERVNFENEYRGNRAFDYLNNHMTQVGADGLASTERNGAANLVAGERNAGYVNAQNERIAAMLGNQNERIGASGIATTEKVGTALSQQSERIGTALGSQAERIHNDTSVQAERIGAGLGIQGERVLNSVSVQNERIATQSGVQSERIANQLGFQSERIATQLGTQNERIVGDVKSVLNTNFTETLNGLHDIRARNTDNFAKVWVEQEKSNTFAYRNTSDLARLALETSGKAALDLQKVEMGLGKLAMEQAQSAMRLNLEGFAKLQIDAAKTEAALSKQAAENTFHLSKQLTHTEDKIIDKMFGIERERLRDKAQFGAARGLVLDEYRNGNFDQKCHHRRHHSRSRSRSHSGSPRRHRHRHDRHDDGDDRRINVITNIRDNNETDVRNRAGAVAVGI